MRRDTVLYTEKIGQKNLILKFRHESITLHGGYSVYFASTMIPLKQCHNQTRQNGVPWKNHRIGGILYMSIILVSIFVGKTVSFLYPTGQLKITTMMSRTTQPASRKRNGQQRTELYGLRSFIKRRIFRNGDENEIVVDEAEVLEETSKSRNVEGTLVRAPTLFKAVSTTTSPNRGEWTYVKEIILPFIIQQAKYWKPFSSKSCNVMHFFFVY